MSARIFSVVLPLLALSPGAGAEERLRIYDTHVHYSKTAWSQFSTRAALEALTRAGVTDALVSSTPDDGTLQIFRADRRRIRPVLRPYRTREDMADWFRNDAVIDYVAERLRSGFYVGIGEFHLFDAAAAETPQMRRLIDLALEHKVMLHVHSGAEPVRRLAAIEPRVRILWAHAGLSEPASVVAALLAEDPDLLTEVSFRAGDIMAGETIDPDWERILVTHHKRIMIGSDTYVPFRWDGYLGIIEGHRRWLAALPEAVRRAIAYENADRIFGSGS